jgi:flavin reductase (DIM6/NTAB) family NADH-FMN oxidoreductase RutF
LTESSSSMVSPKQDLNVPAEFDAKAFRRALGFFPTGVAIMTTVDRDGTPVGLTCNSFSSVSLEPPLVLWSLRSQSRLLDVFRQAGRFAINVLSEGQKDLSTRFASSALTDKFAGVPYVPGVLGVPLIESSGARFECSLHAEHTLGDHVLFIGKVERFDQIDSDSALVFHRGAYVALSRSLRDLALSGQVSGGMLRDAAVLVYGDLARLAATTGSVEDFASMEECLRTMDEQLAAGQVEERYQTALLFFKRLAAAAHNPVLEAVAESLTTIMGHVLLSELQRFKPELVQIRRDLLLALEARQPMAAASLMETYFRIRLPEPAVSLPQAPSVP